MMPRELLSCDPDFDIVQEESYNAATMRGHSNS